MIRNLLDAVREQAASQRADRAAAAQGRRRATTPSGPIASSRDNDDALAALATGERARARRHGVALGARGRRAAPSTCCSSTRPGRCRSPTCSRCRRRRRASCCSAIRSSSSSRRRASHPDGVDVSALEHMLGGAPDDARRSRDLPADDVAAGAGDLRVHLRGVLRRQAAAAAPGSSASASPAPARFDGAGLWLVPVEHDGNQNCVARGGRRSVARIVDAPARARRRSGSTSDGATRQLTPADILRRRAVQRAGEPARRERLARARRAASARWTSSRGRRRRSSSTRWRRRGPRTRRAGWSSSTASTGSTSRRRGRAARASSSRRRGCSSPSAGRRGRCSWRTRCAATGSSRASCRCEASAAPAGLSAGPAAGSPDRCCRAAAEHLDDAIDVVVRVEDRHRQPQAVLVGDDRRRRPSPACSALAVAAASFSSNARIGVSVPRGVSGL